MKYGLLALSAMVLTLVGCAPSFTGEWLERPLGEGAMLDESLLGARRAALQFDPISTVRYGAYDDRSGVVDAKTVAADQYLMFDNGRTAQFGSIIARLNGDSLVASVSGGRERHFTRVRGKSIFPPLVVWPQMYGAAPQQSRPKYLSIHD